MGGDKVNKKTPIQLVSYWCNEIHYRLVGVQQIIIHRSSPAALDIHFELLVHVQHVDVYIVNTESGFPLLYQDQIILHVMI